MKNIALLFKITVLLLFLLGLGGAYGKVIARNTGTGNILADLQRAETGFEKNLRDEQAAREILESDLLTQTERIGIRDRIGMAQDKALAFRSTVLSDIESLKEKWGKLTREQKDTVEEARVDLVNIRHPI